MDNSKMNIASFMQYKTIGEANVEAIADNLIRFSVTTMLPFSVFDNPFLLAAFQGANPVIRKSHLPSRKIIKEKTGKLYDSAVSILKRELEAAESVSLTTDCWTAQSATGSYMCVTCHWIDNNFAPKSALLDVSELPGSHTSELLCERLRAIAITWGVHGKVIAVTTDNAKAAEK